MPSDFRRLVIFGASNIVSDLFDCALANGLRPAKVVLHWPASRRWRYLLYFDELKSGMGGET